MGYSWNVNVAGSKPTGKVPRPFSHIAAWWRAQQWRRGWRR